MEKGTDNKAEIGKEFLEDVRHYSYYYYCTNGGEKTPTKEKQ